MSSGTIFTNNRTQNIRIPADMRFPAGVKTVEVRAVGRELMHGAEKSQFVEKNTRAVEDFTSRLDVVHYDDRAAFHYGSIRSDLEKKGTPIGVNDLHIAGHARSSGLVLVTNTEGEFKRVNGLIVENWIAA